MRGGKLLEEGSPNEMISRYGCSNLEDVFSALSYHQSNSTCDTEVDKNFTNILNLPAAHLERGSIFTWRRLRAQTIKNFYWLKRNIPIVLILFSLPTMQCILFNLTMGHDPKDLAIGVINQELPNGLSDCRTVPNSGCTTDQALSCRYINKLIQYDLQLIEFDSLNVARSAVQTNAVWGMMHFGPNYTQHLMERIDANLLSLNIPLDSSSIHVHMDMSNAVIALLLKRNIHDSFVSFLKDLYVDCGWPAEMADAPVKFERPVYGDENTEFIDAIAPIFVCVFQFFCPVMFTVGTLMMEKTDGSLMRTFAAGMTPHEVIVSHVFVQSILTCIQTPMMLIITFLLYDNPFVGDFGLAIFLMAVIATLGLCVALFITAITDGPISAMCAGIGFICSLSLVSGVVWPVEGMQYILKTINWALPGTLTMQAFTAVITRGYSFGHPIVLSGLGSAVIWCFLLVLMSAFVVRWKAK